MSKKRKRALSDETKGQVRKTLGSQLSFSASEAYKLLRTNLLYTLADADDVCKVVGITSSMRGEGKSTTAVNLAYSLSETGKNILLLEMDMRLPCLAKRLRLHHSPGLSTLLVGSVKSEELFQNSRYTGNLDVITAGDIPPNPAELIGSKRMARLIQTLRESYDFIICDLPPVNAVSDSLVAAGFIDGFVMVVRQNYCERGALDEAMHRLEMLNVNILGFAMTRADSSRKNFRRSRYYSKYGYGKYGYGKYGYGRYGNQSDEKEAVYPAADGEEDEPAEK